MFSPCFFLLYFGLPLIRIQAIKDAQHEDNNAHAYEIKYPNVNAKREDNPERIMFLRTMGSV